MEAPQRQSRGTGNEVRQKCCAIPSMRWDFSRAMPRHVRVCMVTGRAPSGRPQWPELTCSALRMSGPAWLSSSLATLTCL